MGWKQGPVLLRAWQYCYVTWLLTSRSHGWVKTAVQNGVLAATAPRIHIKQIYICTINRKASPQKFAKRQCDSKPGPLQTRVAIPKPDLFRFQTVAVSDGARALLIQCICVALVFAWRIQYFRNSVQNRTYILQLLILYVKLYIYYISYTIHTILHTIFSFHLSRCIHNHYDYVTSCNFEPCFN
jgi:hypothetical protein